MKRRVNGHRGSIVIEMTIWMPIFLLCIYMYIMSFLMYVDRGNQMDTATDVLYVQTKSGQEGAGTGENGWESPQMGVQTQQTGTLLTVTVQGGIGTIQTQTEMRGKTGNPVERLRRWKTIADTVRERGNDDVSDDSF